MTRFTEEWLNTRLRNEDRRGQAVDGHQAWKDREAAAPRLLERDVMPVVYDALRKHPRVAWVQRMNAGAMTQDNTDGTQRFIRFAFEGCSDFIGQMKDGRFIACECKGAQGITTAAQDHFIATVKRWNGIAFVARSVEDVFLHLSP